MRWSLLAHTDVAAVRKFWSDERRTGRAKGVVASTLMCRFSDAGEMRRLHTVQPASEKRQGTKSRVRKGGGAAAMGNSPWVQALMWWSEMAARAILARSIRVNWVGNEPRKVFVTQSCVFEFFRTATLT